jgi:hypothetical protein
MRTLAVAALVTITAATTTAARAAPATCAANISLDPQPGHFDGTATGKVATIKPDQYWTRVHLEPAFDFTISVPGKLPFAAGDTVALHYHCGGGHQIVCDVRLADAHDTTLLISAALGSDTLSDGWTSAVGAVTQTRQDPNAAQKSIERHHALVVTRGALHATIAADRCTSIADGKITWLASGFAIRWEGIRPPEGIDYQSYSLIPVHK